MYKLKFLLTRYMLPSYRLLAVVMVAGAVCVAVASFTPHFAAVLVAVAAVFGAIAAAVATMAILVLNVLVAAGLQRGLDRFEAAYDGYRRANNIPDIFYEEADLAEEAERNSVANAAVQGRDRPVGGCMAHRAAIPPLPAARCPAAQSSFTTSPARSG